MQIIPSNERLYADTNFLTAYLVSGHPHNAPATTLLAQILASNNTLVITPLVIDELFRGIRNAGREIAGDQSLSLPYFYLEIKNALTQIFGSKNFITLAQFEKDIEQAAFNALEHTDKLNMDSRDAFHIAYMQDLGITHIVTNDGHFRGIGGLNLKRIKFN